MKLETIIGLEIHVQLKTKTKMFCGCSNEGDVKPPNTTVCEICLGHPGVLPVPNKQALEWSIKSALALGCEINKTQQFDRKNYYYPDLPKGYQISQFAMPIGERGAMKIKEQREKVKTAEDRTIGITRLHLEEDAAKNTHFPDGTIGVDFNRGGTPLMEIVTEPDFRSPQEARAFLQQFKLIMRYLGVSEADMEKGHLRVDANISLRPQGDDKLYPKTELKNMNSFKAVERALEYEVMRQAKLWQQDQASDKQSTRGWDESEQVTTEQRTKEESHDYRYFPEPDIPSIKIDGNSKSEARNPKQAFGNVIDIQKIKEKLPELPAAKRQRFIAEYSIKPADVQTLIENAALANYFEQVASEVRAWGEAEGIEDTAKLTKLSVNWLLNKLGALVQEQNLSWSSLKITPENFAELITMLAKSQINSKVGQEVLAKMLATGGDPSSLVEEAGLEQMGDEAELAQIIKNVVTANPDEVKAYQEGKETLLQFFVGQVMKASKGKADPEKTAKLLKKELK